MTSKSRRVYASFKDGITTQPRSVFASTLSGGRSLRRRAFVREEALSGRLGPLGPTPPQAGRREVFSS